MELIEVKGASEHNLKGIDVSIERGKITVVTGVSGSGKSSLAFDTILAEAQRRFLHTLSHYSRQFLELQSRPSVRSVTGLSPAIALAQNETMPSRRATVGTLSDLSELLAIMYARFGDQFCPKHNQPTTALSADDIAGHIETQFAGKTVALCAPVANAKKGTYKKQLTDLTGKGFTRFFIDGKTVILAAVPELAKDEKHTIKAVIDYIKIRAGNEVRLARSIATAIAEGEGFLEVFVADAQGQVVLDSGQSFSKKGACADCGFSWPQLDSRHFSVNSLGACRICRGTGGVPDDDIEDGDEGKDEKTGEDDLSGLIRNYCTTCSGTGLAAELSAIKIFAKSLPECLLMSVSDLQHWMTELEATRYGKNPAFKRVFVEAVAALSRIEGVGLGYLALARRVRTLSGGEAQRLRLAGILSGQLRGVLYVLDEPSQGLHPTEIDRIVEVLKQLRDRGNTILIVDHDEGLMRQADWIIDLGPGGGTRGGRILARFHPSQAAAFSAQSETAAFLVGGRKSEFSRKTVTSGEPMIEVFGARIHNLRIAHLKLPVGKITTFVGVSGAGKSSLVLMTLYNNLLQQIGFVNRRKSGRKPEWQFCDKITGHEHLDQIHLIDRKPIAKSGSSIPASYLGILTLIRDLYAALPEGQILGLTPRHFSLSVEAGRCTECKGRGEISLKMRFLADARTRCPLCRGKRFKTNVLNVKYLGLSINEALDLTLDEAVEHFKNHRKIISRLQPAVELGLGYLKLGQPSASLSGGEAQRLKLVPMLAKPHGGSSLVILDEPTTGLHFRDVERLVKVLSDLSGRGTTIVLIEHNNDVIAASDWVVEIGPGAAAAGGKLVFSGSVQSFIKCGSLSACVLAGSY